jgi:hypothetical protein
MVIVLFPGLFGDMADAKEKFLKLTGTWKSTTSQKIDEKGFNESNAVLMFQVHEQSSKQFKGTIKGNRDSVAFSKEITGAIGKYDRNVYAITSDGDFYVGYIVTDHLIRLYSIPKKSNPGVILYRLKRVVDQPKHTENMNDGD